MANNEEKKNVTGLDMAADRKEAEYDLVKALLEISRSGFESQSVTYFLCDLGQVTSPI